MKASRFSDAQKAFILKQGADGVPVADICRRAGITAKRHVLCDPLDCRGRRMLVVVAGRAGCAVVGGASNK